MIRIGIIGCGAIGSAVAQFIEKKFHRIARLRYVSDLNPAQIRKLHAKLRSSNFQETSIGDLIRKSDLIIECASIQAAVEAIPQALRNGKDILILSVGGILKVKNLLRLLKKSKSCLYIPSGGIAGIDAVLAAKVNQIRRVQITTSKPLESLKNSPFFSKNGSRFKSITKPRLIFEGSAEEAIRQFPENVNVAVTLSLAGIGPRKTKVRVFTSPTFRYNQHRIEVEARSGRILSEVINLPSRENPKTSALAIGSAIAILVKIFSRVKIGT